MSPLAYAQLALKHRGDMRPVLASGNISLIRDFPPGHFYSPIPSIQEIRDNQPSVEMPDIALRSDAQCTLLDQIAPFTANVPVEKTSGRRYYLDNPFFAFGDGLVLTGLLQHLRPKRVVEVGSGFSSAAMLDANDQANLGIQFTFIDPNPERLKSLLNESDRRNTRILESQVQRIDPAVFTTLSDGDFLFIDSSHVVKPGSDVEFLLFNILHRIASGVVIHFHDIPWPFAYPTSWLLGGRIWNEAPFVRALLQNNAALDILYFNDYMAKNHLARVNAAMPLALRQPSAPDTLNNSSLWLRKK